MMCWGISYLTHTVQLAESLGGYHSIPSSAGFGDTTSKDKDLVRSNDNILSQERMTMNRKQLDKFRLS